MRKTPAALTGLAVLALTATTLVGCSTGAPAACDRPTSSNAAVADLLTVTGGLDEAPEVTIPTPLHVDAVAYTDVVTGTGPALVDPGQLVVPAITLVDGDTGETRASVSGEPDLTAVYPFSALIETIPGLESALQCATGGSRVAIALPYDQIDPRVAEQFGIESGSSSVAVIDLHKVYLTRAQGMLQFNTGNGLPSVVRAPDGTPGVTMPDAAPPADTVVQTLIKGDGAVVSADDTVRVHVLGVAWGEDSTFENTWLTAPASVAVGAETAAYASALEGKTVGSQVLVVLPQVDPADASTSVAYVVDILGLDAVAAP